MGIIWNLANGAMSFGELEARCESISPTILTRRLRDLQEAELIRLEARKYELTRLGQELLQMLQPLGTWARRWGRALDSK